MIITSYSVYYTTTEDVIYWRFPHTNIGIIIGVTIPPYNQTRNLIGRPSEGSAETRELGCTVVCIVFKMKMNERIT